MKKIISKFKKFIYASGLLLPTLAMAQNVVIPSPTTQRDLMGLLGTLVSNVVLPIGAVLVVMYIIYAGFTFVTAQGKPKEIEEAQRRLLWALIGGGILLGAVGIKDFVVATVKQILPGVGL